MTPNAKRETTSVEQKTDGIRRDAKRSDGFLEATTEGLAFHDVLGDVTETCSCKDTPRGEGAFSMEPADGWTRKFSQFPTD